MKFATSRMHVPSASRRLNANGSNRRSVGAALPGITLLELTVVIIVMLSLISILFLGAQAWKRGSDRALCIINIQGMQKAVRSYANIYGFSPGSNAPNLQSQVIGAGRFIENTPICPGSGSYIFGQIFGVNTIPPMGALYMECSLSIGQQHVPNVTSNW